MKRKSQGNKHFQLSYSMILFAGMYGMMIKRIFTLLCILLFVFNYPARCQDQQSTKKISVLPVPAIGYTPETKTYVGLVTLFTFNNTLDSLTRSSNAKLEFVYTWNKQMIFESDWNYFFPAERWFTKGRLVYFSKYPDLYYGIGLNSPSSGELSFESNRLIFNAELFRNIKNKLFFGTGINYTDYRNIKSLNDSLFYPELKEENNIGIKIIFLKDARNNILSPSKGDYLEVSNAFNFGSAFYTKIALDYRYYFSFGKTKGNILASRFYHSSVFGTPPFYDYPMIGGDKNVRGYYLGRFRDKNFSTFQLELRNHLFWRFGIATFGGISMVYNHLNSIESESFKPNVGVGLRFLVDDNEGTNLRIDYAVGAGNQSGFYISFGESF